MFKYITDTGIFYLPNANDIYLNLLAHIVVRSVNLSFNFVLFISQSYPVTRFLISLIFLEEYFYLVIYCNVILYDLNFFNMFHFDIIFFNNFLNIPLIFTSNSPPILFWHISFTSPCIKAAMKFHCTSLIYQPNHYYFLKIISLLPRFLYWYIPLVSLMLTKIDLVSLPDLSWHL